MTKKKSNFNSIVFTEELNKCYTILEQQYVIIKYMKILLDFKENVEQLIESGTLSGIEITEDTETGDIIIKTNKGGNN